MRVLVTDGENRSALAVTRSLGRRGCSVVVCGMMEETLASVSRFCRRGIRVPDPTRDGEDYVRAITSIAATESIDIIFPMTEQSIYLLNPARDKLPEGVVLACPSSEKVQAISDKNSLFRLAETLRVPIPQTYYLANASDLPGIIDQIDHFPMVVKPALSRIQVGQGFIAGGVRYVNSRAELEQLYATSPVLRYPSMIQEKIIGSGTGLFTLYDKDRHLALFSHRRLREKPPSGGVSVVSESVPLDEEMVDIAGRLLSAVGWTGVAMVEFKRDERDGKAKLMEINGRFWGSLQLAIACGVDFPALALDYLQGKRPPEIVKNYLVGHKLKWFFGTLDHLLIRLKQTREELNLPPGAPSRGKALAEFLRLWEKNTSFDVFSTQDMGPFFFEGRSYFANAIRGKR